MKGIVESALPTLPASSHDSSSSASKFLLDICAVHGVLVTTLISLHTYTFLSHSYKSQSTSCPSTPLHAPFALCLPHHVWGSLTNVTTVNYPTEQLFLWDPGTASPPFLLDSIQYHPSTAIASSFPSCISLQFPGF